MADPRVYPSESRPSYHVDYSSDMSGEMPPGAGNGGGGHHQSRYNYSSGSSGEMPRQPSYKPSKPEFSGEMPLPRNPPKHHVVQIPKDQIFKTPPPQNARLQKIYAARAAQKRNRNCCCFIKYLILTILLLLLLIVVAGGVFYVMYKPRIPNYGIDSLTVKNFNVSTPNTFLFSPEFEAAVTASNPNPKIGIYYGGDSSDVITVSYKNIPLANGVWPEFYQPANNVTKLIIPVKGSEIRLSKAMHDEILQSQNSGAVPLNLNMKVPVRIRAGAITTWTINVFVSCDLTLDKLAAGSTVVNKSCSVKVHAFNKF